MKIITDEQYEAINHIIQALDEILYEEWGVHLIEPADEDGYLNGGLEWMECLSELTALSKEMIIKSLKGEDWTVEANLCIDCKKYLKINKNIS